MKNSFVFQNRAVAFLDILGFTALTKDAEKNKTRFDDLSTLLHIIDSHVKYDNVNLASSVPDEIKPRYIFISDSIIISSPLEFNEYNGLSIIILKAIQIAHKLLEIGCLLRGGISIGTVWHDNSNIIGTGYIDAFNAEKNANYPRIILTKEAENYYNNSLLGGNNLSSYELCVKYYDEKMIVDTLHPLYSRNSQVGITYEDTFSQYRSYILNNLQNKIAGSSERSKWEWMATFFNRAISQHQVIVMPFTEFPFPPN